MLKWQRFNDLDTIIVPNKESAFLLCYKLKDDYKVYANKILIHNGVFNI